MRELCIDGKVDHIGAALKAARVDLGMTMSTLAELTGIHRPNIARIERGNHTPSIETLQKIARALGARLVIALDGIDRPPKYRTPTTCMFPSGCSEQVTSESQDLFCPKHWEMISYGDRQALRKCYTPSQSEGKVRPTKEWFDTAGRVMSGLTDSRGSAYASKEDIDRHSKLLRSMWTSEQD